MSISTFLEESTSSDATKLIRIPQIAQSDGYTCGVAAVQSILLYYGKELKYAEIEKGLRPNPKTGTDHDSIINFIRSQNLSVTLHSWMSIQQLKNLIDQDIPVIVCLQAWKENRKTDWAEDWKDGHYAVAIGYDINNIYFMDPSILGQYGFIPIREFVERWHDVDKKERLFYSGIVVIGESKYNPNNIKRIN